MKQIHKRLTYANVVATIALFIAVGGASAFAATQLAKNSVGSSQLKKNAVTTSKIKSGAVTGAKIKRSTLGKVPSASRADTAADASTLQGNPAGAFMQGGGRFFSVRRELLVGDSEVALFTIPGIGPLTGSCSAGTTSPKGGFKVLNNSGVTVEQTLQYGGGVDGGTALPGKTIGFGGNEGVDAVTVQVATRSAQPVVATLNLSFLKTDAGTGCNVMGQATVAGG